MYPIFPEAHAYDGLIADDRQQALTDKWLVPDIENIAAGIALIRARIDTHYERLKAKADGAAAGKADRMDIRAYPYGFCEPIRDMVWHSILHSLKQPNAGRGHFAALREFAREGGHMRAIWGELTHGPYLQNAMQFGAYYADASNDTVVISKPKLDIRFLADTNFRNVESFEQYFDVTRHYYQWDVYPNLIWPRLAPLFPGIAVHIPSGALQLCDIPKPLFFKNLNGQGALARRFFTESAYAGKRLPAPKQALVQSFLVEKQAEIAPWGGAPAGIEAMAEVEKALDGLQVWLHAGKALSSYRRQAQAQERRRKVLAGLLRSFSAQSA